MALKPGTQLGTFEILALIGAGGMGEVYKARDHKLNRLVAIKVLPPSLAADQALLARFDREAKAVAALSHPNVLGIFDLATQDGLTYAVMELLEGESLRDRLKGGALPPKRAIEIATELAQGLGAAHERGLVHRDVKPENIFITSDGRVKVLDFGLAKQVAEPKGAMADLATEALSLTPNGTEAGMVLGTAGYMSPEQVKGEAADHRSDIFSFGVVLYEMLSGQRPFRGETAHHTMTAILDQDPPALVAVRGPLPPALERLVAHCLEKHPKARFQSMADIAFALQNLSTLTSGAHAAPAPARRRWPLWGAAAAAALLGLALGGYAGLRAGGGHLPTFTRLTHTPGTVETAFFGLDGKTIYFSERIQGGRPELFVIHPGSPEPQPLGIKDALLMGVSRTGELAIMREPRSYFGSRFRGMLAQADAEGHSLKDLQEHVVNASWDGGGLATFSDPDMRRIRVEFAGKVVLEGDPGVLTVGFPRTSPDGSKLAMIVGDAVTKTDLLVYDRNGQRTVLYTKTGDTNGDTFTGLAWTPEGDLWLSELLGDQTALWSVSPKGARHLLWRGEGTKALMDVSRDGRVLLVDQQVRRGVLIQKPGEALPRDVSIASATQAMGFSADGRSLLLMESPVLDGGSSQDVTYLWTEGNGSAVRLGPGTAFALSADGRWASLAFAGFEPKDLPPAVSAALREGGVDPVAAMDPTAPAPYVFFMPTGAGRPFALALPKALENVWSNRLSPDGKWVYFSADEHGEPHWYAMERKGGPVRALTSPEYGNTVVGLDPLAVDGTKLLVGGTGPFAVLPLDGTGPQLIRGLTKDERPVAWAQDARSIYVRTRSLPIVVSRLDLATGTRHPVFSYQTGDASGLVDIRSICTTPDARIFALSYIRELSDLYLAEGLR